MRMMVVQPCCAFDAGFQADCKCICPSSPHFCSCFDGRGIAARSAKNFHTALGSRPAIAEGDGAATILADEFTGRQAEVQKTSTGAARFTIKSRGFRHAVPEICPRIAGPHALVAAQMLEHACARLLLRSVGYERSAKRFAASCMKSRAVMVSGRQSWLIDVRSTYRHCNPLFISSSVIIVHFRGSLVQASAGISGIGCSHFGSWLFETTTFATSEAEPKTYII